LNDADSCEVELTDAEAALLPTGLSQRYFTTLPAAKLLPEIVNVRFIEFAGTDVKDNEAITGVTLTQVPLFNTWGAVQVGVDADAGCCVDVEPPWLSDGVVLAGGAVGVTVDTGGFAGVSDVAGLPERGVGVTHALFCSTCGETQVVP